MAGSAPPAPGFVAVVWAGGLVAFALRAGTRTPAGADRA